MLRISSLPRDGKILFVTRMVRMFGYGLISVVLVLYLAELRFSDAKIGLLVSLTLLGDTMLSLWITSHADGAGRRRMLLVGAILMLMGGFAFSATEQFAWLLIAATFAVISPSGGEVGPFLAIELASLSQVTHDDQRTNVFAWYNMLGSVASAIGALAGGLSVDFARRVGLVAGDSYRPALLTYAAIGGLLAFGFSMLSSAIEATPSAVAPGSKPSRLLGLHRSRRVVLQLSGLFALDAFGGGFVIQSLLAYWLHVHFGLDAAELGGVFFGANLLAGFSALAAGWLSHRIGLVNTMVFTHLPSNVLLLLVPLMPSAEWAIALLLARFSISQMDVPTRQAYTMAVVSPDERSAASGVTTVARSIGAAISPTIAASLMSVPHLVSVPLYLAGTIKIAYDLMLWRAFAARPPHEVADRRQEVE